METKHVRKFNRKEWALFLVTVLSVAFAGSVVYSVESQQTATDIAQDRLDRDVGRLRMGIHVVARSPDGTVKGEYSNDDDLATRNFYSFLKGFFTDHAGADVNVPLVSTGNNAYTIKLKGALAATWYGYTGDSEAATGGYIAIGNSTTAPALNDYRVLSQVGTTNTISSSTYASGNVTIVGSVTINAAQTNGISEAALIYASSYSTTVSYFVMFRETFTAIPVSVSDILTVTWTLQLANTGFNDNFGIILADMFDTHAYNEDVVRSFTDVGAGSQSIRTHGTAGHHFWSITTGGVASTNSGIKVGTSSTAATRTQYHLGTNVSNIVTNSIPDLINNTLYTNVTFASNIILASNYTIAEAGWFTKTKNTAGDTVEVMIWRTTFTGYAYTASDCMTVQFKIRG